MIDSEEIDGNEGAEGNPDADDGADVDAGASVDDGALTPARLGVVGLAAGLLGGAVATALSPDSFLVTAVVILVVIAAVTTLAVRLVG